MIILSIWLLLHYGQAETKPQTSRVILLHPDCTTVSLHGEPAERQPQP